MKKISFSSLKRFLEQSTYEIDYFNFDDDLFYGEVKDRVVELKDYEAEKRMEDNVFWGYIDFYDTAHKHFYELKVRSNYKFDKWVILQCEIYKRMSGFDYSIVVINRKEDYKYKIYSYNDIVESKVYKNSIDWINFILEDIVSNQGKWVNDIYGEI